MTKEQFDRLELKCGDEVYLRTTDTLSGFVKFYDHPQGNVPIFEAVEGFYCVGIEYITKCVKAKRDVLYNDTLIL